MESELGVSVLEHGSLSELSNAPDRRLPMAELVDRLGLSPQRNRTTRGQVGGPRLGVSESPRENRRTVNVIITADGRRAYVRNNRLFTATVEETRSAISTQRRCRR